LSHVIERAVTLSEGEWIDGAELEVADLPLPPPALPHAASSGRPVAEQFNLEAVTRHLVLAALEKSKGHKGQAATLLGIHPRTLTRMLRRFAIPEE